MTQMLKKDFPQQGLLREFQKQIIINNNNKKIILIIIRIIMY